MKKRGILNAPLSEGLARLGHGDLLIVADCGLPLPLGSRVIDLALVPGVPTFEQVLDALLDELAVEGAVAATEAASTPAGRWISSRLKEVEYIPHEEFKQLTASAKLIVRTGEATPYANIALRSGVPF
jgi:D-ribose pyranase